MKARLVVASFGLVSAVVTAAVASTGPTPPSSVAADCPANVTIRYSNKDKTDYKLTHVSASGARETKVLPANGSGAFEFAGGCKFELGPVQFTATKPVVNVEMKSGRVDIK